MGSFKRAAVGTAAFAAGTLGILELDNMGSNEVADKVAACYNGETSVQSASACAEDVAGQYETQATAFSLLEILGVAGVALGATGMAVAFIEDRK